MFDFEAPSISIWVSIKFSVICMYVCWQDHCWWQHHRCLMQNFYINYDFLKTLTQNDDVACVIFEELSAMPISGTA